MTAGFAPRPGWGFVRVHGPDAWRFLQDLVSQDLDPLDDGSGAHSLLLTPQGKIDADFRILRVGDEAWLDGLDGPALAASLVRFRIRVDVEIEDRSAEWSLLAVRGDDAVAALGAEVPVDAYAHVGRGDARVVRSDWPGVSGVDVVGPRAAVRAIADELEASGIALLDDATFERLRIEAGVVLQGVDVDERTIPQEAFLEDAVSFTKGCFLGQELVCRIDTRGHVNRYLRKVEVADAVPAVGAELHGDEGKTVGTLTSVAARPDGGAVALAMVRREIEPPAELEVTWDGNAAPASIR